MSKKVTKGEIVESMAQAMYDSQQGVVKIGKCRQMALAAFDNMTGTIGDTLANGGSVTLPGLFRILVIKLRTRKAYKPTAGKVVTLPDRAYPKLEVSRALRGRINIDCINKDESDNA
ncbi:MAG: HU family DNA-binding protein [Marinospirillum sp.]|uniref:HU family DNA-binding protein n=1 Tax=Marinospirillum sp. TaxID=2183934 RepID=UPI001A0AECCF|nr:HU family DNA-binding protein [Marinospirillum sp.]MBE0505882.1 HU family DNA-binding protein [Marinospirillum sp.]